jgi:acyl carrier protein
MDKKQFVLDTIKEILQSKGKSFDNISFSDSANLRDDIGLSSFNLAELTVKIEHEFDVDIFADGLITTLGEIWEKVK